MQTTDRQRLVAHIAQASDQVNLAALFALDETPALDDAGKLVRGLITEHLYGKHPQVKAAYDAWAEDLDDERTGPQVIAEVLSAEQGHIAMHHRADGTCVFDECQLTAEPSTPAVSAVVLHDEPALKTVVDQERPWETDEVWDPVASYQCGMRHATEHDGTVGWREHEYADTYGRDLITQQWVPFYEVRLPGDEEPSRFCEDCMVWLTEAADHIRVEA